MKLFHTISAVLLAAGIACSGAAGAARLDPDHYLLTRDVFTKLKAIEAEFEKSGYKPKDDDAEDDDEDTGSRRKGAKRNDGPTADELMRQIESDKVAMAALKRHNLSSRDYALTMIAMFHAGFYVMFENSMDKKGAADLLATYTREQRANVAFVRAMNLEKKK